MDSVRVAAALEGLKWIASSRFQNVHESVACHISTRKTLLLCDVL